MNRPFLLQEQNSRADVRPAPLAAQFLLVLPATSDTQFFLIAAE
jgi:hypothetical protein